MYAFLLVIQILVTVAGCLALLISIPLFFAFRWPAAGMWGLKVVVSAISPLLLFVGIITALVGWTKTTPLLLGLGIAIVLSYAVHIFSITRPPGEKTGFKQAFGQQWENSISPGQKKQFLSKRFTLLLPSPPTPRLQQDVPFATVLGTSRALLCDIWQPPEDVQPSGLGFIFLHGSAFYILDKDCGTRRLFSHLSAQGHVIMDVAYRLAPETDILGMVHDVKRAIIWMRENAGSFGIDPKHIMVGGGSSGGHLALLAAYTVDKPFFTPADLRGKDFNVCAVLSIYGTSDLAALYYHTNQHLTTRSHPGVTRKSVPTKMPGWLVKLVGDDYHRFGFDKFDNGLASVGTLAPLLGGHPDEYPDRYTLFSPISHVHAHCPRTLLIHGAHDIMAPITATRRLYQRLQEENVPVVLHVLPQTDHAFDMAFPRIAPATHNAIYDIERFMAFIAASTPTKESIVTVREKTTAADGS